MTLMLILKGPFMYLGGMHIRAYDRDPNLRICSNLKRWHFDSVFFSAFLIFKGSEEQNETIENVGSTTNHSEGSQL